MAHPSELSDYLRLPQHHGCLLTKPHRVRRLDPQANSSLSTRARMPIPYPHRRNPLEARVSKVPETPDPMAKANSMTATPPLYAHSYIVASGGATVSRPDFRTLHAPTKERGSFGAPVAACE